MTSPALFVVAHPDDETLAMSVSLAEHLRAGQDVHVLWMTRGEQSSALNKLNGSGVSAWWGVAHDPPSEGYAPLTPQEFGAARILEATNAMRVLGSGYSGTLTLHEAQLDDGAVSTLAAQGAITAVADVIAPGAAVRLKAHSHLVDDHPDHVAIGLAAEALKLSDPARFGDVRHYILPAYWADSRLSTVSEAFDTPADAGVTARVKNACKAFKSWSPPYTYAIGYHSVPAYFNTLESAPKSMVHP